MTTFLIITIKAGIGIETIPKIQEVICWPEVYRMAAQQGVAAIAWDGVQRLMNEGVITKEQAPDRVTKLQWALSTDQTEKRYNKTPS